MMLALGITLLVLGGLCIIGYWAAVLTAAEGQYVSPIPLICGGLAFAGCALIPAIGWKLGLLALLIDPGCWCIPWLIVWGLRYVWHRIASDAFPSAE
ncbi:MAG TPA: hypothetical protein VIV11_00675 [Kofleriaceae bacterium]